MILHVDTWMGKWKESGREKNQKEGKKKRDGHGLAIAKPLVTRLPT